MIDLEKYVVTIRAEKACLHGKEGGLVSHLGPFTQRKRLFRIDLLLLAALRGPTQLTTVAATSRAGLGIPL
jgi:hypothetical protein